MINMLWTFFVNYQAVFGFVLFILPLAVYEWRTSDGLDGNPFKKKKKIK